MKFQANKTDLVAALARANQATTTKGYRPVFAGLLCEARAGGLQITGTDGETTIHTWLDGKVEEEGRALIPGKLLEKAVRSMPKGLVIIATETDDDEIVDIIGGENYSIAPQVALHTIREDEHPFVGFGELENIAVIDGATLSDAVAQVMTAIDKGRGATPVLEGILFEPWGDGVRLVATDRYRLAIRDLPGVNALGGGLVPARGLKKLKRVVGTGDVSVGFNSKEAVFFSERGSLRLRLIEGEFPKYRFLFPKSFPSEVVIPKENLLDTLGRAAIVDEDTLPVSLTLGADGIEIGVTRQGDSRMKENVPGSFYELEYGFSIAFNIRYFTEGVAAVAGDQVRIQITDENKPGLIQGIGGDNFRYLLMPVRVK